MSNQFIGKVLSEIVSVTSHEWLDNGLCLVHRREMDDFTAGFVWKRHVKLKEVSPLIDLAPSFIASVPAGAFWDGAAMQGCEESFIGWGGIGTFQSACRERAS